MRPRLAAVSGLVHSVASGEIGANDPRTRPHVNDVRIARRHRDGTDGASGLFVEQRKPRGAVVGGPPYTTVIEADVEDVRLTRNARQRTRAASTHRSNRAPLHAGRGIDR